jgi:hypothetical protein
MRFSSFMKNQAVGDLARIDGDQFKAISADLALVQSCVVATTSIRKLRRDFQRWDVMGGLVVRLKALRHALKAQ